MIRRSFALALLSLMLCNLSRGQEPGATDFEQRDDRLLFSNQHVRMEFQASQFANGVPDALSTRRFAGVAVDEQRGDPPSAIASQ